MFDIGFWELVLVGVVALVVFGPERLPRVAREAGLWVRKARAVVASVKSEIDHELQLQDMQNTLREQKNKLKQVGQSYTKEVAALTKDQPSPPKRAEAPGAEAVESQHERE
jgi:sec-independent protein translocase protein TatB